MNALRALMRLIGAVLLPGGVALALAGFWAWGQVPPRRCRPAATFHTAVGAQENPYPRRTALCLGI